MASVTWRVFITHTFKNLKPNVRCSQPFVLAGLGMND